MANTMLKFEKDNCQPCAMVGNYLDDKGVEYKKLNPFKEAKAQELSAKFKLPFQLPVVVVIDEKEELVKMSRGYNEDELDELIGLLG